MLLDNITTVIFDLDGTLLPMNEDSFRKLYFSALAKKCAPLGYEPQSLIKAVLIGTDAMVNNDGTKSNKEVFWERFSSIFGERVYGDIDTFDDFYRNEFICAKEACGVNPTAAECVKLLKEKGIRVGLATNPLFPQIATEWRVQWAGFEPSDFEILTAYENSSYCKPNLDYYRDVCSRLRVKPENCLMVGNDVTEDMCAEKLGMKVFLLTDCLMNKNDLDYSSYPQGGFDELLKLIKE